MKSGKFNIVAFSRQVSRDFTGMAHIDISGGEVPILYFGSINNGTGGAANYSHFSNAEVDELLAKADFISVHAPAVDGGALINAERIAKMKDGVVIINTSRGTNVDEAALLAGLESGKVRAAGLDVYADEPATNKALYSHPMVSCTPHIGAATVEAQKRIGAEIVDIISKM